MRPQDSILSAGSVQGYVLLLIACGGALLLSIPSGARVAQLMDLQWHPSPILFHAAYVVFIALLGTFRGITAARSGRPRRRALLRAASHLLFAQVTVLPCLFFARALLPGKEYVLPLLVLYSSLAAGMHAMLAFRLELWGRARGVHTFMLQYALFGLILVVPWSLAFVPGAPAAVTLFSPIGVALRITQGPSPTELLIAFAFVVFVLCWRLIGLRRIDRRPHAV